MILLSTIFWLLVALMTGHHANNQPLDRQDMKENRSVYEKAVKDYEPPFYF